MKIVTRSVGLNLNIGVFVTRRVSEGRVIRNENTGV